MRRAGNNRLGPGVCMRAVLLGAVGVGLLVGVVVAITRVVGGGGADDAQTVAAGPSATPEATSPEGVVTRFAEAWSADDIESLFALLDPASQAAHPLGLLIDDYDAFAVETTQTGVTASLIGAGTAGASVAVLLDTRYFGTLEYTVDLSLVQTEEGTKIAWDTSAMHPSLGEGRRLVSNVQRPLRGAIYDREGAPLAISQEVRMLGLNRSIVSDRASLTAAAIGLGLTQEQVDAAFNSGLGANQRVAIGPVPDAYADAANEAALTYSGLLLYFETQRTHPLGAAAAHVVGYTRELTAEELGEREGTGYRIGDRTGAVGLEAGMDAALAGSPGGDLQLVDSGGSVLEVIAGRPFVQGADVHTTLDSATLLESYDRLQGRAGAAVTIDPQTNEILAISSSPSFDPDAFERQDSAAIDAILATEGNPLNNRATGGLYSAGSTFKLITGAAGLSSLGLSTGATLPCTATWNRIDPPLNNWEGARGDLTIAEALMRSCNPVFWEIGFQINAQLPDGALSAMAKAFGFGAPTGVVGFGEETGLVPDPDWKLQERGEPWIAGDDINLAIGQGDLLVTPLQLANAYSSFVVNQLRAPVVIQGEVATARGALPLTVEQHAHLALGLELVTSASGTAATAFANSGYFNFAGKSGTAEDANEQQHVLFVAYSPAGGAGAVSAVVLDEGQSGSQEAGPIARDIVLAALN